MAQLTTVTPGFDGSDAAPLAALQLAVRTWRAVGVLRAHAEQHPDAFDAFTAAQLPRAECPLAWQPVNFFAVVLGSGFLLAGIGRVAACCRFLGGRRGGALWGQRAGVSLCEAAMRELCGRLDEPGSTRAVQTRLCLSAGRQLLRLASPLPLAPRVCERTLRGHTNMVNVLAACAGVSWRRGRTTTPSRSGTRRQRSASARCRATPAT